MVTWTIGIGCVESASKSVDELSCCFEHLRIVGQRHDCSDERRVLIVLYLSYRSWAHFIQSGLGISL